MINSFLQNLSTWVTAKSNTSKRIDLLLLSSITFLRATTMCSEFDRDCGYDQSNFILIGDVYCPITKCSCKLCLHKKTFESRGRSHYQCPHCASVSHVRNISLEDPTIFFSRRLVKGYTFSKRVQSQFKILLEMSIVLASFISTERNAKLLTVM